MSQLIESGELSFHMRNPLSQGVRGGAMVTVTETNQLNPQGCPVPCLCCLLLPVLGSHFLGTVGHPDTGVEKFLPFQ